MPGYVIHIAVAKEYIKKHKKQVKNEEEFMKGAIAPDLIVKQNKNITKNKTHYGKWENGDTEINFEDFLADEQVKTNNDYWKGYLLHLLVDHYFCNIYFCEETREVVNSGDVYQFHYDYDCLNKELMEIYKIQPIEEIKDTMNFIDAQPKYLSKDKIIDFIENISDQTLEKLLEEVNKK